MKKYKLAFLFLVAIFFSKIATAQTNFTPDASGIYWKADTYPDFAGGEKAEYTYINTNAHMPDKAVDNKVTGKVWIQFVVNEDGSVSNVIVRRGIGFGCDEEAVRVISSMPKWTPGAINGKPVKMYQGAQVNFNYQAPNKAK